MIPDDPLILRVLRRMGVERLKQELGRRWRRDRSLQHDIFCGDPLSVESLVGVVVRAKRGTRQRNARKQSARAGIGEDFSAKGDVGFCGSVAANWSGGGGSVATDFHFTAENAAGGTLAH
jgi:hypothetical protein